MGKRSRYEADSQVLEYFQGFRWELTYFFCPEDLMEGNVVSEKSRSELNKRKGVGNTGEGEKWCDTARQSILEATKRIGSESERQNRCGEDLAGQRCAMPQSEIGLGREG